jgi:septum formation inhibitor MinC
MKTTIKALSTDELTTVIAEINQAILTVKNSTKAVFFLLKNARETLNADDYEKLKKSIDLDKSTINKIEKIFQNSVVMSNLESLPISWGTLYELAQIDTDALIIKITDGKIHNKSTKEEITTIKKALNQTATSEKENPEVAATSEKDKTESAKTHTKEVKKLLEQLKEYFEIPSNLEQFFNEVA